MEKKKYFIGLLLLCFIVSVYLLYPEGPSMYDMKKIHQKVKPISYKNTELKIVLADITSSLEIPVKISVCKEFLNKKITLETETPTSLEVILKGLSIQMKCELQLFSGIHREIVKPIFICNSVPEDYTSF